MLKLTKKADYGLIAMRYLAEHARSCSAKDVAEAHGLPQELVAKVLQRLAKAGLLVSQHGSNGGYVLSRHADAITAFEVIRAIEGPLFLTSCVTSRGECEQTERCTVKEPLRKVSRSIEDVLSQITISELVRPAEERGEDVEALVSITH